MSKNITVLVATAGQGVMRTNNGGHSWARAGIDQGMHSDAIVRCLSTDPGAPQTLLAGTDKGLYSTPDAGRTWQLLDTPLSEYSVWNLTRDPRNPNVIYAGTGTPTPAALFKSTDRGETWQKLPVQVAETCPNVGVPRFTGLAVDPHNQDRIWAGIEVDGVRHSSDGGLTWRTVNGAISNPDVHSLAIVAGPPQVRNRHRQQRLLHQPGRRSFLEPGPGKRHLPPQLPPLHNRQARQPQHRLPRPRRLYPRTHRRNPALQGRRRNLGEPAPARRAKLRHLGLRDPPHRPAANLRRQPLRLSLPQRRRRRLLGQRVARIQRNRRHRLDPLLTPLRHLSSLHCRTGQVSNLPLVLLQYRLNRNTTAYAAPFTVVLFHSHVLTVTDSNPTTPGIPHTLPSSTQRPTLQASEHSNPRLKTEGKATLAMPQQMV